MSTRKPRTNVQPSVTSELTANSDVTNQETQNMQSEQTSNESAPVAENAPIVDKPQPEQTPDDATANVKMDSKTAKAITNAYDNARSVIANAYASVDKILSTLPLPDEQKTAFRLVSLTAQGYTGDIDADTLTACQKLTVLNYNVADSIALARESLVDKMVLFAREIDALNTNADFQTALQALMPFVDQYKATCAKYGVNVAYSITLEGENGAKLNHRFDKSGHKSGQRQPKVNADGTLKTRQAYDAVSAGLDIVGKISGRKVMLRTDDTKAYVALCKPDSDFLELTYETFRHTSIARDNGLKSVAGWLNKTNQSLNGDSNTRYRLADIFSGCNNLYDETTLVTETTDPAVTAK